MRVAEPSHARTSTTAPWPTCSGRRTAGSASWSSLAGHHRRPVCHPPHRPVVPGPARRLDDSRDHRQAQPPRWHLNRPYSAVAPVDRRARAAATEARRPAIRSTGRRPFPTLLHRGLDAARDAASPSTRCAEADGAPPRPRRLDRRGRSRGPLARPLGGPRSRERWEVVFRPHQRVKP